MNVAGRRDYYKNIWVLWLRADVSTMLGGGLGQIIQASMDDPSIGEYETMVIVGGSNDSKKENFSSNKLFVSNIDKSLEKLKAAAAEVPHKNFVLVPQLPFKRPDLRQR